MRGVYEVLSVIKEWIDKRDFYSVENFYRELKTSSALVIRSWIIGSSAKRAIIIFVSRRNLPFTDVYSLTVFFYCL